MAERKPAQGRATKLGSASRNAGHLGHVFRNRVEESQSRQTADIRSRPEPIRDKKGVGRLFSPRRRERIQSPPQLMNLPGIGYRWRFVAATISTSNILTIKHILWILRMLRRRSGKSVGVSCWDERSRSIRSQVADGISQQSAKYTIWGLILASWRRRKLLPKR